MRVHAFDIRDVCGDGDVMDVSFRVRCSKGTYIRTLATDLGRVLGVGGHLAALKRTASGERRIEGAAPLEELVETDPRDGLRHYGLSLAEALGELAAVRLTPSGVRKVRCGTYPTPADLLDFDAPGMTPGEASGGEPDHLVRLLDPSGELVAMARTRAAVDTAVAGSRFELVRVI